MKIQTVLTSNLRFEILTYSPHPRQLHWVFCKRKESCIPLKLWFKLIQDVCPITSQM